ncbi:hypothetical protein H4R26_002038 [Coemansia thaxteri]|uniref:Pseudouridine synthase RsuA/RluA-like domain-containing protein n=1 Tax=Coemansia thaxteri TaxID=2663907 RepID=A0A9W8BF09_9FUNG|nr:hypothetical protein H4R26_002038 [Coemansia thaxteri]
MLGTSPLCRRLLTVPPHAAGLRLDRYIRDQLNIPPSLLHKLLRKRAIAPVDADGRRQSTRLQGSDRVHSGMCIHIPDTLLVTADNLRTNVEQRRAFAQQRLPMLFENDALAVVKKPSGLSCQGGTGVHYSVDAMLADMDDSDATGYRLVHRLDRDTTGALVVAKSRLAAAALAKAFHDRTVTKRYIALLRGIPPDRSGTITHPLYYDNATCRVLSPSDDERCAMLAKPAVTKYRVLKTGSFCHQDVAIVEFDILTGRKHQIRVHAAQVLQCPVLGDHRYNANSAAKDSKPNVDNRSTMYLHLFEITDVDSAGQIRTNSSGTVSIKAPFPVSWAPVFQALKVQLSH